MRPRNAKEKRALKEADEMVTALGKRWGAQGVMLIVAFAEPTGTPGKPLECEVCVLNVVGGAQGFKDNLPDILRNCAEGAEQGSMKELQADKPGDFPRFMTDLLQKETPDTN